MNLIQNSTHLQRCEPYGMPVLADDNSREPEQYDSILSGCRFGAVEPPARQQNVVDATGRVLGSGRTREQACWFAARVRRAEGQTPERYQAALAGCSFGVEARDGVALRTVVDRRGRLLGVGLGMAEAAHEAMLTLLRDRPAHELSRDEFSHLCVVVTVEVVRGKTGKATTGPARLQPDPRCRHAGLAELIHAVGVESEFAGVTPFERKDWIEARLREIYETCVFDGTLRYLALAGGQHLILRKFDSPPASACITEIHNWLRDVERRGQAPRMQQRG